MSDESRKRALNTAANVLQYRHRSAAALRERLIEKEIDPDDADYAVARLCELGYLNDRTYAEGLVRALAARGYGKTRIRAALREKKLEPADIDGALACFEPDRERMQAFIAAKLAGEEAPDRRALKRVSDGLFRRGFSWEEIRAALRDYLENETDE